MLNRVKIHFSWPEGQVLAGENISLIQSFCQDFGSFTRATSKISVFCQPGGKIWITKWNSTQIKILYNQW